MTRTVSSFLVVLIALLAPAIATAQTAENVAVVINEASADSVRIAEHYIRVREIPAANVIRIKTATDDNVARARYVAEIETPISVAIRRASLEDRLLYIVLTKGIPLQIQGTAGQNGSVSSVDSELTLLYRRMTGRNVPVLGKVANPFYLGEGALKDARRFNRRDHDVYLVSRLTAYTVDEAIALIDRGRAPTRDGSIVLDQRAGIFSDPIGDRYLSDTQAALSELGFADRVVLEATTNAARDIDGVLGYYSWGSNDPEHRVRTTTMRFRPGAIAAMFVSRDARTFDEPPADWKPSNDVRNRTALFRGAPQSLTGDLIRDGVTGVVGHVAEHYLQSAVRPQILFPAYVSGFNLVEAFYLAMPDLSWQAVVVGDPLCAPFERPALSQSDVDGGVDKATELPSFFAARRLETARAQLKTTPVEAITAFLRGESRVIRGQWDGAREAFEAATKEAPEFAAAQLQLALVYEQLGDHANAAERYRAIVKLESTNVIALNNLAYSLAVRQGNPKEGLPFARRAFVLAPNAVSVVDTLAWVEHLLGNSAEAARLLRKFVQNNTGNAEIHLHAAIVFAAAGDLRQAKTQLQQALTLDPALGETDDVKALQQTLGKP
jgi:uncharacterized protein (TIGR03790 family)